MQEQSVCSPLPTLASTRHRSRSSTLLTRTTAAGLAVLMLANGPVAQAHNLDQRNTQITFDDAFIQVMAGRSALNQPLVQVNDEFWVVLKSTPGPGTLTGVGGYLTFYIPNGVQVIDAAYLAPTPGTPGSGSAPANYTPIAVKGQSIIAIGSGPIGPASTPGLSGLTLANNFGQTEATVTATGTHRGTVAGVYADTGIFFSTDPRTSYQSWSNAAPGSVAPAGLSDMTRRGYPIAMVNNRGETQVPVTRWDAEQLIAYGRADVAPAVDPNGRGSSPWGLANVVAGPQSGYAWEFNLNQYVDDGKPGYSSSLLKNSVNKVGPWKRIQYPGSQYSKDQAGLISSALGYAGQDASSVGVFLSPGSPLPPTVSQNDGVSPNAVRFSYGMLELGRSEHAAVKIKIITPPTSPCWQIWSDAFGGDAGGEQGGKDHEWRYYDPTIKTLNPCAFVTKVASDPLIQLNESMYFTITFANMGNTALPGVTLTDPLPTGLTFLSSIPAQSSGPNPLVWNLGTVQTNQLVQIKVFVKGTSLGSFVNTVTATSTPPGGPTTVIGEATDTVEVSAKALLFCDKEASPSNVAPGGQTTYTLHISNAGTGPNGVPLVITEYLPTGFTYGSLLGATLNGAALPLNAVTVNASNPGQPTFTINQSIQGHNELILVFTSNIGASVPVGTYFNDVSLQFENKVISCGPDAPVTVGGGQIGDTVFRDWNGDGIHDPGEEGIAGVTVNLYAGSCPPAGLPIQTKVTDSNGNFLFTGLPAGNYCVDVPAPGSGGIPSAYTLTTGNDPFSITLALNESNLGADFGYKPAGTGTIGDMVFEDLDKNGTWDAGEPGIPNVTVNLYEDSNGNGIKDPEDVLAATAQVTNGSGLYQFTNLDTTRSYLVDVDQSDPDIGAYFTTLYGNSANLGTSTDPYPVASGFTTVTTADFGFWRNNPATVGDQVFVDSNNSGVYDGGDLPLANVTVRLYASNGTTLLDTTVSALDGTYSFPGLSPGTYVIKVDTTDPDIPIYLAASVTEYTGVTLVAGQTDNTRDFPFANPGLLGKTVDKSFAAPPDTLTFTLTPYYPGPHLLVNAAVTDTVPAGTTFNSAGQGGANIPPVTWNLGSNLSATNGFKNLSNVGSSTITLVGTNTAATRTSQNLTNAMPAGTQQNDLLLACVGVKNNSPALNVSTPSGWTFLRSTTNTANGFAIWTYYKFAGASESAVVFTNMTDHWLVGLSVYRNVDTNSPIDVHDGQANASSTTVTAPSISTTVTNTMLVGFFGADMGGTFSNPSMTEVYQRNTQLGGGNEVSLESSGQLFAGSGPTGTKTNKTSIAAVSVGQLIALKPASTSSYNYDVTTALAVNRRLVTSGASVTVTLTATATGNAGTVTPGALTVTGVNGATGSFGAASPVSASLNNGTTTFTYTGTVSAGTVPGSLTFSVTPTDTQGTWATGTSPSLLVTPPLTFTVDIPASPGVNVVSNSASISTNGVFLYQSPSTFTALNASIGDFVWDDINGDQIQDPGEPGIPGVRVYHDVDGNGQYDGGEPSAITDASGLYRIYGFGAGTYTVRYDYSTVPAGFVPTTPVSKSVTLAAGEQYDQADFGLRSPAQSGALGSIGDTVWLDSNRNGAVDGTEVGLTNKTVLLYWDSDSSGTVTPGDFPYASTNTDSAGTYLFTNLPAGPWVVTNAIDTVTLGLTLITGGSPVTSPPANNVHAVNLAAGANESGADFGYVYSGTIGDTLFYDDDGSGFQNGAEAGVPGSTVTLYDDVNGDGQIDPVNDTIRSVAITCSAVGPGCPAIGYYLFDNLPPGDYIVKIDAQSVVAPPSSAHAGQLGYMLPTVSETFAVTLAPGSMQEPNADFGFKEVAVVDGHVFWDQNSSGVMDAEPGLPNVTVELYNLGPDGLFGTGDDVGVVGSVPTDGTGGYRFTPPEGHYRVRYVTSDPDIPTTLSTLTTPIYFDLTVLAGVEYHNIDFGRDNSGAIGDRVWNDANGDGIQTVGEPGMANVTVLLYDSLGTTFIDSTITDPLGGYHFTGLADATYVVKIDTATVPVGYTPTGEGDPGTACGGGCDSQITAIISGGNVLTNVDFGYTPPPNTFPISGNVWNDNGAGGTAGNGIKDGSEPGIPNVTVCLYLGDGTTLITCIPTDANGDYSFPGNTNGTYVVRVDPASLPSPAFGQTGDPDGTRDNQTVVVVNGAAVTGKDFGYREVLASIAGTIVKNADGNGQADVGETPVSGVTVTLRYAGVDGILHSADDVTATTTTDGNGDYVFDASTITGGVLDNGLLPGQYEITKTNPTGLNSLADRDGGNPDSITLTIAPGNPLTGVADNQTDQDFELYANRLGNLVWYDLNANGIQDGLEPGVTNVTVELYDSGDNLIQQTQTDSSGLYAFTEMAPGSYYVKFILPGGYSFSPANVGSDDTVDSDANAGTGKTGPVTVSASGTVDETIDAGLWTPVQIGNLVWYDINSDGTNQLGEPGIQNVMVTLLKIAGGVTNTAGQMPTDVDGKYIFTGLQPGTYQVVISNPPAAYPLASPTITSTDLGAAAPDNVNNGTQPGIFATIVWGPVVQLTLGQEPVSDGDGADSNLTLDFGFRVIPTLARFGAVTAGDKQVAFTAVSDSRTIGYDVYRLTESGWVKVNPDLVVANEDRSASRYRVADAGQPLRGAVTYRFVELDESGNESELGTATILVVPAAAPGAKQGRRAAIDSLLEQRALGVTITVARSGITHVTAGDIAAAAGVSTEIVHQWLEGGVVGLTNGERTIPYSVAAGGAGLYFHGDPADGVYRLGTGTRPATAVLDLNGVEIYSAQQVVGESE